MATIQSTGISRGYPLKRLIIEYKQLTEDKECRDWLKIVPRENVTLLKDGDTEYACKWDIFLYGFNEETLYAGYMLEAEMYFPVDYPLSPPKFRFANEMFHPNIYKDGKVCISILHMPRADPFTDEPDTEQWTPVLGVRTILLSIILLLNEPNTDSPANVEASKLFRESKSNYEKFVRKNILPAIPKEQAVPVEADSNL